MWFFDASLYSNTHWTFWDVFVLLFFWIPVTVLWAFAIFDVFRQRALSGVAKVLWLVLIVLLPLIGVLSYLIFRPVDEPLEMGQMAQPQYTGTPTSTPPQVPTSTPPQSGQPASSAQ
jgi:hypothetical protein